MKKRILLYFGVVLFALPIFAQDSLKIDFNRTGSVTEAGWDAIDLSDRAVFTNVDSSFAKFSSTVYVKPVCLPKPAANNHRAIDRNNGYYSDSLYDVLDDWIAADVLAGTNDTTTTIGVMLTGLPAGMYAFKSYHHDNGDQRPEFTTKIENKAGVIVDDATQFQVTQSQLSDEPGYAVAFEDVGTYEFGQIVSAGIDDTISVLFTSIYPYRDDSINTNQSLKLLLLNGFELTQSSSEAFLSELSLKGGYVLSPGFDKDVYSYDVVLSYDATLADIPGVMYMVGEGGTADTTRAAAIPGSTTIEVTSQDGSANQTYTINFTLAGEPSNDSTLVDLAVTGFALEPAFDKQVFDYTVELLYGTAIEELPAVVYTAAPGATHSIMDATALPGATKIDVKAENGTDSSTYTINFTIGEPSFAPLMVDFNRDASETEDGWEAISATDRSVYPDVFSDFQKLGDMVYVKPVWLTKPAANNHRAVDRNSGEYSDSLYEVLDDYIAADLLAGTEDTTTTIGVILTGIPEGRYVWKSYHHDAGNQHGKFTVKVASTEGLLFEDDSLYATSYSDGGYITAFDSVTKYINDSVVSKGVDDTITVSFTHEFAYRADTLVNDGPQSFKFVIINGFELAIASPNAYLTSLSLEGDDTLSPVFHMDTLSYDVELPYGSTVDDIPGVMYTAGEDGTVDPTRADALPGATTLVVTSQDGSSNVTYTINFTEADPSTDASLTALSVDGYDLSPVFASDVITYDVELDAGSTVAPDVTYTAATGATAVVTKATELPGETTVVVTAEDGTTTITYTINFTVRLISTDNTDAYAVRLYPNPAINTLSIELSDNIIDGKVYVYNVLGGMQIEQDLNNSVTNIDISALAKGTYSIKIVNNGNDAIIKQFVKN